MKSIFSHGLQPSVLRNRRNLKLQVFLNQMPISPQPRALVTWRIYFIAREQSALMRHNI